VNTVVSERAAREIVHGSRLAELDPETIWGWRTPAGRIRAARRGALIADGASLKPGDHALEIGCGTGLFTEHFIKSGATIVAVDISEPLLMRARAKNLDAARVTFVNARFEALDIQHQFDAVIGSSVLHHLDVEASLAHIFTILEPGGRLSFAEPNMLNPVIFLERRVPALRERWHVSPDETAFVRWPLRKALERHGFVDIRIMPFDWLHPFTPTPLIRTVRAIGRVVERLPFVREFSGSMLITARKPVRG
jgi:2-polyprenyl-3-methyl-5-hydroxy-6-metoxy-1,4-benzoquinol methylase